MAKPQKSRAGIYSLTVSFDYQRRKLTLGKIEKREADRFAANIEFLKSHRKLKSGVPVELESWIQSLSAKHVEQLGQIGLIGKTDLKITVQQLIDQFLEDYKSREDIADSTKKQVTAAVTRFPRRFLRRLVCDVEPQKEHHRANAKPVFTVETRNLCRHVESWQREHYAKATWSRANGRMREIGVWAVEHGICNFNPFSLLPVPGEANQDRNIHVESEWVLDAMDQCLDPDTRLLFALGRFAGLRLPSEARTMKPSHILADKSQLQIFDSKKKKIRTMPLFSVIRDELERHREVCGGWDRYVLTKRCRENTDANNYSLMLEAVARTQWDPWPRLRQNLRASCENDLLRMKFDERLVVLWIGHTIRVSRDHYQSLNDSDYTSAASQVSFD